MYHIDTTYFCFDFYIVINAGIVTETSKVICQMLCSVIVLSLYLLCHDSASSITNKERTYITNLSLIFHVFFASN